MTSNTFYDAFKAHSYLLFSYPIRVALFERKTSVKELIKMLAKKGYIYDFNLLQITLQGKANNHFTLHYFTHLYKILSLPYPSPEYLYKSFVRWEEIKEFKKERRNTNRIKRGLEPIP